MNAHDLKQVLKGYGKKREVIIRLPVDNDHEVNFRLTGDFSADEHPDTFVLFAVAQESVYRGPLLDDVKRLGTTSVDENGSEEHSRKFTRKDILKFCMWYFSYGTLYTLSFFSTLTLIILSITFEQYLGPIFGIILIVLITGAVSHRVFKPVFERFRKLKR